MTRASITLVLLLLLGCEKKEPSTEKPQTSPKSEPGKPAAAPETKKASAAKKLASVNTMEAWAKLVVEHGEWEGTAGAREKILASQTLCGSKLLLDEGEFSGVRLVQKVTDAVHARVQSQQEFISSAPDEASAAYRLASVVGLVADEQSRLRAEVQQRIKELRGHPLLEDEVSARDHAVKFYEGISEIAGLWAALGGLTDSPDKALTAFERTSKLVKEKITPLASVDAFPGIGCAKILNDGNREQVALKAARQVLAAENKPEPSAGILKYLPVTVSQEPARTVVVVSSPVGASTYLPHGWKTGPDNSVKEDGTLAKIYFTEGRLDDVNRGLKEHRRENMPQQYVGEPTYEREKANWFVMSGYLADDAIYYEKSLLGREGKVVTMVIEFEAKVKPYMSDIVAEASKSFVLRPDLEEKP